MPPCSSGNAKSLSRDPSVFIYAVEENPNYVEQIRPILNWVESRKGLAVTSSLTMLELLVQSYRLDNLDRVDRL